MFVIEENQDIPDVSQIPNLSDIQDFIIDDKVILDKLTKLNINKSAGPDDLHPRVLFELRNEMAYLFKLIFEK